MHNIALVLSIYLKVVDVYVVLIGYLHKMGLGLPQDYSKAFELYTKSADQGNTLGLNGLGMDIISVPLHFVTLRRIGNMYYHGQGVRQDYNKALECYTKSASQGNADSLYSLGYMYKNGLGVQKDLNKAIEMLLKAADQGNTIAQNSIGTKIPFSTNN